MSADCAATPVKDSDSLIGKASGLLALYSVFFFFSGWTFFDFYYRSFGLSPRWVDLSSAEILTKGFTILKDGGGLLWFIYLIVLILPIIWDLQSMRRYRLSQTLLAIVLILAIPAIFEESSSIGMRAADLNKGRNSTLPVVSFKTKEHICQGKLLLFRSGNYYFHDVRITDGIVKGNVSTGDPTEHPVDRDLHVLTVVSQDKVEDLKIVEFPGGSQ